MVEKALLWYRDFYDVPRLFAVAVPSGVLVFESPFLVEEDEYSTDYVVKLVPAPSTDEDEVVRAAEVAAELVRIPIANGMFDETRRQTIRLDDASAGALRSRGIELD